MFFHVFFRLLSGRSIAWRETRRFFSGVDQPPDLEEGDHDKHIHVTGRMVFVCFYHDPVFANQPQASKVYPGSTVGGINIQPVDWLVMLITMQASPVQRFTGRELAWS